MRQPSEKRFGRRLLLPSAALLAIAGLAFLQPRRSAPPSVAVLPTRTPSLRPPAPVAPALASHPKDKGSHYRELRALLASSPDGVLAALFGMAQTDPAEAINLAQALGRSDEEKADWVMKVMGKWADREPQAAWQWLTQLSTERMSELAGRQLTTVVLNAMATSHPEMIIANASSMLRDGNLSEAIPTPVAVHLGLAALIAHGDVALAKAAVEDWVKDPAGLPIEAAAFETVATGLMGDGAADAGAWLRAMPANGERNAAIAGFTATWAQSDPTAALQWAESLAPAEGQIAALNRSISDWVERNPQEVSQWLGDHLASAPADANADKLVETLINLSPLVRDDPAASLQWTSLISDPTAREAYEEKTVVRWASQDPAAALTYVQQSPTIPAERKVALVERLQSSGRPGQS